MTFLPLDSIILPTGYTFPRLSWSCWALSYTFGMLHVRPFISPLSSASDLAWRANFFPAEEQGESDVRIPSYVSHGEDIES